MPRTRSGLPSSTTSSRLWPEVQQSSSASVTLAEASTVTTAGIGVITSRASCSCRWKTPRSITASPGSRSPPTADWEMISFRSSEVCFSSMSAGRIPNRRRIALETLVSAQVNGAVTVRNRSSGRARRRALPSARVIAIIFGTCSPTVMCSEVASAKAIANASAVATPCESPPNSGSISYAIAGSPRKPIPIEAIVIPSWQAERYSSMRSSCTSTRLARFGPRWRAARSCRAACAPARTRRRRRRR